MKQLLVSLSAFCLAFTLHAGPACCPKSVAKSDKSVAAAKADAKLASYGEMKGACSAEKMAACSPEKMAACSPEKMAACKAAGKDCPPGACAEGKAAKAEAMQAAHKAGKSACSANMKELAKAWQQMQTAEAETVVDTAKLKKLIGSGMVTVLDARTSNYDDGARIPSAKLIGPAPSAEEIAAAVPSKDSVVVTYCGSKACPLSGKLASKLRDMGYKHVMEYPAGIAGWKDSGNDVAKVAAN